MKALIAMSGGVDSSVSAFLMKEKGYDCIGCTMKLYTNEDIELSQDNTCCSLDDIADARNVADRLGMPYYVFNLTELFREKVIDKFVGCYECGMTPNPCIDCNRHLKFEKLHAKARELGCDKVVTGHYARIEHNENGYFLLKALDDNKDQSYVLYQMNQELLAHSEFPLGSLIKDEVRHIAESHGFINADKPDSQDICFVPDGDYVSAIKRFSGKEYPEGDFVDKEGNVFGRHRGIIGYTIGQRKGLGIAYKEPLYVIGLDTDNNKVILGSNDDLMARELYVKNVNWINPSVIERNMKCEAKIRYRQKQQPAVVELLDDNLVKVIFDEPQRAITPGQAAVFYQGDIVLGGGTIISEKSAR